jgi:hypothetical protein
MNTRMELRKKSLNFEQKNEEYKFIIEEQNRRAIENERNYFIKQQEEQIAKSQKMIDYLLEQNHNQRTEQIQIPKTKKRKKDPLKKLADLMIILVSCVTIYFLLMLMSLVYHIILSL